MYILMYVHSAIFFHMHKHLNLHVSFNVCVCVLYIKRANVKLLTHMKKIVSDITQRNITNTRTWCRVFASNERYYTLIKTTSRKSERTKRFACVQIFRSVKWIEITKNIWNLVFICIGVKVRKKEMNFQFPKYPIHLHTSWALAKTKCKNSKLFHFLRCRCRSCDKVSVICFTQCYCTHAWGIVCPNLFCVQIHSTILLVRVCDVFSQRQIGWACSYTKQMIEYHKRTDIYRMAANAIPWNFIKIESDQI